MTVQYTAKYIHRQSKQIIKKNSISWMFWSVFVKCFWGLTVAS